MAKIDTSSYTNFEEVKDRFEQIVAEVKKKDLSLEHSLDLFDEAIALGSKTVELVDVSELSPSEQEQVSSASSDSSSDNSDPQNQES